MTNPNNAIGTNGAYSGRTSPNALNDCLSTYTKGVMSGWGFAPKTGMTIECGGSAGTRDVAIAEDNAGNKITINNRSGAPVPITIEAAPSVNSRIDAVVAYVDNPSTGDGSTTDNPTTCGIIAVKGTAAANPTVPDDAAIRAAITVDGATGGTAYYVKLAEVLVGTGVTTIGSGAITEGFYIQDMAELPSNAVDASTLQTNAVTTAKIASGAVTADKTAFGGDYSTTEVSTGFKWVDNKIIYKKTIYISSVGTGSTVTKAHGITNFSEMVRLEGALHATSGQYWPVPQKQANTDGLIAVRVDATNIYVNADSTLTGNGTAYVTLYYTKSA